MSIRTILLTGARAPVTLDLARSFYRLGCRVICVDSLRRTICSYSKCVDRYYLVCSPAQNLEGFLDDLEKVISDEKVELLIPTCEEALYVAKIKDRLSCEVFSSSFEIVESLHNKWTFYQMTEKWSPKTQLLKDKKLKPPYVVKQVYSRFAAYAEVIREERAIEDDQKNPKIAQAFVEGESYCSYAVALNGKVRAHSIYKVLHSIGMGASMSSLSVDDLEITRFVTEFVEKINYTGQISFDFIRSKERLYVIECNPRATSGIHLFECSPGLAKAFLEKSYLMGTIGKIYHEPITMLLYGFKQKEIFKKRFLKNILMGKNVLFQAFDFGPLFFLPLVLFEIFKLTLTRGKKLNEVLSEDLEYNGEDSCVLL